jgi:nucleotide-binding universal stress UspA family protein
MKTILAATDFSKTGNNAVNYAASLALTIKSKLIVFHAYHSPIVVSETPITITAEDFMLEEKSNEQLDLMVDHIIKKFGTILEVEYISIAGFASNEITDIAKEKNIDLVVIGTHETEKYGKHSDNNTLEILKHNFLPILIIPDKVEFNKIDSIVYATDFITIKDKSVLQPFIEIVSLFNSKILIYNTQGNNTQYSLSELAAEGIELEETFENLRHSYSLSTNKNIINSMIEYAKTNQCGMITMVKRHHNLFHRIFTASNTEQMALQTTLPLLILREATTIKSNSKIISSEQYSNN